MVINAGSYLPTFWLRPVDSGRPDWSFCSGAPNPRVIPNTAAPPALPPAAPAPGRAVRNVIPVLILLATTGYKCAWPVDSGAWQEFFPFSSQVFRINGPTTDPLFRAVLQTQVTPRPINHSGLTRVLPFTSIICGKFRQARIGEFVLALDDARL